MSQKTEIVFVRKLKFWWKYVEVQRNSKKTMGIKLNSKTTKFVEYEKEIKKTV